MFLWDNRGGNTFICKTRGVNIHDNWFLHIINLIFQGFEESLVCFQNLERKLGKLLH